MTAPTYNFIDAQGNALGLYIITDPVAQAIIAAGGEAIDGNGQMVPLTFSGGVYSPIVTLPIQTTPPTVSTGYIPTAGGPGSPAGGGVPPTPTAPGTAQRPIYRLILLWTDGTYATGANYPGCSQSTSRLCDPQSFRTLTAAVNYARDGNEIPIMVRSQAEAWAIVAGNEVPDTMQILSYTAPVDPFSGAPLQLPPVINLPGAIQNILPPIVSLPPIASTPAGAVPIALLGALGLGAAYFLFRRK
jgi:hypothetical protein